MNELRPTWELPLSTDGMLFALRKGGRIRIRPVRPSDFDAIQRGFDDLSPRSVYFRFFTARSSLGEPLARMLTDIDHHTHFAWSVFDPDERSLVDDPAGRGVAAARLILDKDPTSAEAALTVIDEYHHRGIGRFLIELLMLTAADVGVDTVRFVVLRENRPMRGLISAMGASTHAVEGDRSVIEYRMTVPEPGTLDVAAGALYQLLRLLANKDQPGD